ncbi:hypothetical protein BCR33DRAFT_718476 [Rhizoclosmatium globosum]|uniref:Thioesterase/thiol ester dehydrase-isomerase n=1 Tax=Rhizoclosmatium globosum TaxID=329046 RepID=A0A1Y2C5L5_9FUNG|nr:hypothetical protein BCR33DRAFT_718476 [Rhizoclosmatium globosum]|eukprot:ORY42321.1 hypothetical protein BCR33DRAFT_718476 [Rhizoclosmatium globosum]
MNRLAHLTSRRFQSTSSKVVVPVGAFASVDATRASLPPKVAELLREYPSVITLPVQWGEQDSYGHLNNVYYCRYFESGRLAHFEQVGSKFLTAEETERFVKAASYKAVGPIVKSVNINYRKVVDYPDTGNHF